MSTRLGANPNQARSNTLSNLKKGGTGGGRATRYVTAGQLLDAFENKFGMPFAEFQMDVFHDYFQKTYQGDASKDEVKTFMTLFMHFSNKLTQGAPQQVETINENDPSLLTSEQLKEKIDALHQKLKDQTP